VISVLFLRIGFPLTEANLNVVNRCFLHRCGSYQKRFEIYFEKGDR
tara:strand:- start:69026 stop:69163 length:138 start_codon:yes stop_codon:yes gene_type:complete